ncbi:hypothetical protein ACV331_34200, partial [Pseudomonas aeruginosa]
MCQRTLIRVGCRSAARATWAGEDWMEGQPVIRQYDEEHYALQAAIAGQGLVLASSILVSESVASGLLQPYR